MKFDSEKLDGLLYSIGITAIIIGLTYASKIYYFSLQKIPFAFLSFNPDDFTTYSFVPIMLASLLVALYFYSQTSFGLTTKGWKSNAFIETIILITLMISLSILNKVDAFIFNILHWIGSTLLAVHFAALFQTIILGTSKKIQKWKAEHLAIKAEVLFLKEENERIMKSFNIASSENLSDEQLKQIHQNRIKAISARLTQERVLEKADSILVELFIDFHYLSKYARYLSAFIILLAVNCYSIKLELQQQNNRFSFPILFQYDKALEDKGTLIYSTDSSYFIRGEDDKLQVLKKDRISKIQFN